MQTEVGYKIGNIMKKIIYMLLAALGIVLSPACGGSGDDGGEPTGPIAGEWRLASWNADSEAVGTDFEVYASFKADGTFDLYQKIETVRFLHLTGSYSLAGSTLTGQYANGQAFGGAPYEVSFDAQGNTMTLVSAPSVGEVQVYVRASIPAAAIGTKADIDGETAPGIGIL